jgi:hypothetical protein
MGKEKIQDAGEKCVGDGFAKVGPTRQRCRCGFVHVLRCLQHIKTPVNSES